MTPYTIAKAARDTLEAEYQSAVDRLNAASGTERGPFGLTPDHIKSTPEWRAAWNNERRMFGQLRAFNMEFGKVYAKELKAERDARRNKNLDTTPPQY